MKSDTMMTDQDFLREYLLGELPEDKVAAIEQRLLEDDKLFDLAEAIEGDLLVACVRGELSPEERQRVLRRLAASPQGQARLALAQGLTTLADQEKRRLGGTVVPFRPRPALPTRWSTRVAAIAASLAVAIGVSWLAQQTVDPGKMVMAERGTLPRVDTRPPVPRAPEAPETEPQTEPTAPAASEEDTQVAETPTPPAPQRQERTPEVVVPSVIRAVVAFAHTTRSGGASEVTEIEVPQGTKTVEIHLPLTEDEEATSFRAVLLDATEQKILQWEKIDAIDNQEGGVIIIPIPTTEIPPGKYAIEVRGLTSEGEYELLGKPAFEVRQP